MKIFPYLIYAGNAEEAINFYVDTLDEPGETYSGDNISLSIDFSDVDEMKLKFGKLAEGGKITMPVDDTFWGATFGMLIDKYGIHWMFNCDKKPVDSTTEVEKKSD